MIVGYCEKQATCSITRITKTKVISSFKQTQLVVLLERRNIITTPVCTLLSNYKTLNFHRSLNEALDTQITVWNSIPFIVSNTICYRLLSI